MGEGGDTRIEQKRKKKREFMNLDNSGDYEGGEGISGVRRRHRGARYMVMKKIKDNFFKKGIYWLI